jgi:5'-3' exoribonuclease 2
MFILDRIHQINQSFIFRFELSTPFKPFEQLMGVLPPQSGHCLPQSLKTLIRDKTSSIADFYPKYFKLDINGHRYIL